ncbi:hypothetical protein BXT91_01080 [Clostridium perfringens]|nr:hypothetical protein BXT91_01080 [Clostridium perfringens]
MFTQKIMFLRYSKLLRFTKKLNENVYLEFKIISLLNPIKFLKLKSIIKFLGFMSLINEGKIKKGGFIL